MGVIIIVLDKAKVKKKNHSVIKIRRKTISCLKKTQEMNLYKC